MKLIEERRIAGEVTSAHGKRCPAWTAEGAQPWKEVTSARNQRAAHTSAVPHNAHQPFPKLSELGAQGTRDAEDSKSSHFHIYREMGYIIEGQI